MSSTPPLPKNGHTPGLLFRLGRDKECSDFLRKHRAGDNVEILYAPGRKSRVEDLGVAYAAMLTLLKVRVLIDLRVLNDADEFLGSKLPVELFNQIRSYKIGLAMALDSSRVKAVENREDLNPLQGKIEMELRQLRVYVTALNKDYWPAIADLEKYRAMQPMYQPELPIVETLAQTYEAWSETPRALEVWSGLCKG